MKFKARVSKLSGTCPNLDFTAEGRRVVTDSATGFRDGTCLDMRYGIEVEIEGDVQSDAVVHATRIEIKKN